MQNLQNQIKKDKVIIASLFVNSPSVEDEYQIDELERLINTLGGIVVDRVIQYRKNIDSKFYIGKGKLKLLYEYALEKKCNYIVINNDISPSHIKNIQSYFKDKVFIKDRVGIILDIFVKHAKTKEAKTQIKLAQLEYVLPRLTRQWTHLERQMGGIGTRGGPGETQIEIDRRLIRNQIIKLKKELIKISKTREIQKNNRKNIFKVSLVGYTNAGKSTIMQQISNKKIYIKDELFATLDTNTKKISIDRSNHFLLSDTVGFIRNLPDNLIASFRSTLSEIIDSNLLLKIIDISSPEYSNHLISIDSVLKYLNISEKKYLIIFNKVDLLHNNNLIQNLKKIYPDSIFVSGFKKINIDLILKKIKSLMNEKNISVKLNIPYNKTQFLNKIYNHFEILKREDNESDIRLYITGNKNKINKIIEEIKK
tara:strand:- start:137 stop:1408 length:1272 start_codon:yes stop_codon:yes gene_type:complete